MLTFPAVVEFQSLYSRWALGSWYHWMHRDFQICSPENLSLLYWHSRLWMNIQLIICWFLLIDSWMWQMHAFINICSKTCFAIPWHYHDVNPSVIVILSCWLCWVQDSSIKVEPIDTQNWLQVGFSTSVRHLENPLWNFNQIKIFFKGLRMVEPTFWKKTQKM